MHPAQLIDFLRGAASAPALAGIYIKSVRIAATYNAAHDPIMTITWSMPDHSAAIEAPDLSLPGVSATIMQRPSDTCIRVDRSAALACDIDRAVLAVAWTLGAWDVRRLEKSPLRPGDDPTSPKWGIGPDFGVESYRVMGTPLQTGDNAPRDTIIEAATEGYVSWLFVPLALATPTARKRWGNADRTLTPGCTRDSAPPKKAEPMYLPTEPGTGHEHIYQLGRANHGNRSGKNKGRRA